MGNKNGGVAHFKVLRTMVNQGPGPPWGPCCNQKSEKKMMPQ